MLTDVAELVPCNVLAICGHCQQSSWGVPYIHCDATLVKLLPTKDMLTGLFLPKQQQMVSILSFFLNNAVFLRRCATPKCAGILTYDGSEHSLLNMKKVLFAYELLRGFMFHFLLGQYVKRALQPCTWLYILHSYPIGPPCTLCLVKPHKDS